MMVKEKCKHLNDEPEAQPVEEGYFMVRVCQDCSRKEYFDYYHNGDTYEHPGFTRGLEL